MSVPSPSPHTWVRQRTNGVIQLGLGNMIPHMGRVNFRFPAWLAWFVALVGVVKRTGLLGWDGNWLWIFDKAWRCKGFLGVGVVVYDNRLYVHNFAKVFLFIWINWWLILALLIWAIHECCKETTILTKFDVRSFYIESRTFETVGSRSLSKHQAHGDWFWSKEPLL